MCMDQLLTCLCVSSACDYLDSCVCVCAGVLTSGENSCPFRSPSAPLGFQHTHTHTCKSETDGFTAILPDWPHTEEACVCVCVYIPQEHDKSRTRSE